MDEAVDESDKGLSQNGSSVPTDLESPTLLEGLLLFFSWQDLL